MKKLLLIFVMLNLFQHLCIAQNRKTDSLLSLLKTDEEDTSKVKHLNALCSEFEVIGNKDTALYYAKSALQLSKSIVVDKQEGWAKGIASSLYNIANMLKDKASYSEALKNYNAALSAFEAIGNKKGVANAYNSIGSIYNDQGNYPEALKNFFASLKIREAIDDKKGIAACYSGIGIIFRRQGNYPEALKNYAAAMKIEEAIGDKNGIATSYHNIGFIYMKQGNFDEALKNYLASLSIREAIGDKQGIGDSYSNIGGVYESKGNLDEALNKYFASLKIRQSMEDKWGIAASYGNIANALTQQKKYKEAEEYLNKTLELSKQMGVKDFIQECYSSKAQLDSIQGNYKSALSDYKQYILYKDSLINEENLQKTLKAKMQFEFDKKLASDSIKANEEKELSDIKLQRQTTYTYGGYTGLAIVIMLLFFVYRNYNKQREANKKLKETQEQLIKSEKMAAFGVMASKVAHEILNPLNFINNFAQLNQDLVKEVVNSKTDEEKKEAAVLLIDNNKKIKLHGERMENIVKELQKHTREGTAYEFFEKE